jgi:hypothetical protein
VSFWPNIYFCRLIRRCCILTRKKGPRSTFARFTHNKSCLLQCCDLKLNQIGPYLHWSCWWDKWSIDIIFPSSSSNTTSQIICTQPKFVTNRCRPFQIKPQTIVTWIKYAANCFSCDDLGVTMLHQVSLNCRAMNIQWWWAPFNSPHTISTHTLLNLQCLKSHKCVISHNPTWHANINIWTNEATQYCDNFWLKRIHTIMLVWIPL